VRVAVFDHGTGNIKSVARALEAAGAEVRVTGVAAEAAACDGLCLPGQGVFGRCMRALEASGADGLVRTWISENRPYLGICLGMQVLFDASEESPEPGLGVVAGDVVRLRGAPRLPHIGWNEVAGVHYYFDHSYVCVPADESLVSGWCEHGELFPALIENDSLVATQFHPEKSAGAGRDLLTKWVQR
jgi:imidazole glycerol phosphate synthase glutamine amidotransferase subunit